MIEISIDKQLTDALEFLEQAPEKIDSMIDTIVINAGKKLRDDAQDFAPYKKGHLKSSITEKPSSDYKEVVVGTNKVYAPIHEFGGIIKAKNKPYLHFPINGNWVRTKQVRIPKYKGRGYFAPAMKKLINVELDKIIKEQVDKLLK